MTRQKRTQKRIHCQSHHLPHPGQIGLHQMEEPASGEEDRQGEVDGDKKQNGESHAGHDLA